MLAKTYTTKTKHCKQSSNNISPTSSNILDILQQQLSVIQNTDLSDNFDKHWQYPHLDISTYIMHKLQHVMTQMLTDYYNYFSSAPNVQHLPWAPSPLYHSIFATPCLGHFDQRLANSVANKESRTVHNLHQHWTFLHHVNNRRHSMFEHTTYCCCFNPNLNL